MLRNKVLTVRIICLMVAGIYLFKLAQIQLFSNSLKALADDTAYKKVTIYPVRGLIYDRNGKLTVYNDVLYDLNVIPNQLGEFDTAEFCRLLPIEHEELVEKLAEAKTLGRSYIASTIIKQLSPEAYAHFAEFNYKFPGFFATVRTIRSYPYKCAAHVLGNIGEVDKAEIKKSNDYYRPGDYIGKTGIESSYEEILRGKNGVEYTLIDRLGRVVSRFNDGGLDSSAVAGRDLVTSLDIELQQFAESLMQNKKGSVVAIEPSTGEILTFVSSPGYDPNLLVGRDRGKNYLALQKDKSKPLFNRPLQGQYPPGSTYKPIMALLALQDGTIKPDYGYACGGRGYVVGRLHVACHGHAPASDVNRAIQYSCNAYFCHIFRQMIDADKYADVKDGFDKWYDMNASFGLGKVLGIDLPSEKPGNLPSRAYYDERLDGNWRSSMILSLGIGQGEIQTTPLQLANLSATIANRGFFYTPHVVKKIDGKDGLLAPYKVKRKTMVSSNYFDSIVWGMQQAIEGPGGTARLAIVDSITVCGKTGTAQNPHGKDHSVFIAFAPKINPKIAIAVVVENAGYGGTWAAPVSGLLIEQYLKGSIPDNKQYLINRLQNSDLIN